MTASPPPNAGEPDFLPPRDPCMHCLTGEGVHFERWDWTLTVTAHECAIELYRDGRAKLTVPLTADQVEVLMDGPVTMSGVLGEGL